MTKTTSPFSKFADSPFKIQHEGVTIEVIFNRTSPTTATISWTDPHPETGCEGNQAMAYDGAIVTIDTSATDPSKFPVDGSRYVPDAVGDADIHAGDKLGTALVVGATYGDNSTRSLDVTGLDPLKAYYVSLHAVDAQLRYHSTGVHSYSLNFGNTPKQGIPGYQIVKLGENHLGVVDTDGTGLDPSATYNIVTKVNGNEHVLEIVGSNALTYGNLIRQFNIEAAKITTPVHSVTPPNAFGLYLNVQMRELYRWTGSVESRIQDLFYGENEPASIVAGQYALNSSTNTLYLYNGATFNPLLTYASAFDPTDPTCGFVWYDGINAHNWIGVWEEAVTYTDQVDPSLPKDFDCTVYWYNSETYALQKREKGCNGWSAALALVYPTDPTQVVDGDLWMDEKNLKLNTRAGGIWVNDKIVKTNKTQVADGEYYFITDTGELQLRTGTTFINVSDAIVWYQDPTNLKSGNLWWNEVTSELFMWQKTTNSWVQQVLKISTTDPRYPIIEKGSVWINGSVARKWDGSQFIIVNVVTSPLPINQYTSGIAWLDRGTVKVLIGGAWTTVSAIEYDAASFNVVDGSFWYKPSNNTLYERVSGVYNSVPFSSTSLRPKHGTVYFNTYLNKLMKWNGMAWVDGDPIFSVKLDQNGFLRFETLSVGSGSFISVPYYLAMGAGTYPIGPISEIFLALTHPAEPQAPVEGQDPQSDKPSYMETGVGTDGTADERREMMDSIRYQLGYPQVEVELTKLQMENAIDNALETLRQRSGMSYTNAYMFMDLKPGVQTYHLTNRRLNHHKIVSVDKIIRIRSAFMSAPQGAGVYGQSALQHMYQMGSMDLIAQHLVAQYVETANELFASQITCSFNESTRMLSIFKNIMKPERVLVSVSMERTEQDLFKDRYLRQWIQGYAKAQCRYMLAEIRGKYASLPGAGGGVSLNAAEMAAKADMEMATLLQDIDDFIVTNPEDYSGSTVLLG